jgi:hypothetical protein
LSILNEVSDAGELSELVPPFVDGGEWWFKRIFGLLASRLQDAISFFFCKLLFDDDEGFFVALSSWQHFARRFLNQT